MGQKKRVIDNMKTSDTSDILVGIYGRTTPAVDQSEVILEGDFDNEDGEKEFLLTEIVNKV